MSSVTHSRLALRRSLFSRSGFGLALLRPLLTSRSSRNCWAFTHKARSPRVRTHSFAAQPPDLRRQSLDHESFAVSRPLALPGNAFYPVLVHRLAASLHASSPHSVTLMQLRFASFAVINLQEDLHLQECARAGRTQKRPQVHMDLGPGVGRRDWTRTNDPIMSSWASWIAGDLRRRDLATDKWHQRSREVSMLQTAVRFEAQRASTSLSQFKSSSLVARTRPPYRQETRSSKSSWHVGRGQRAWAALQSSSRLRSIQAVFSCTSRRCVSTSAVG
jgi:hypothetical protein